MEVVEMREIDGRGRGLVSRQPIKSGEVLLRDSPILLYSAIPLTNQNHSNSNNFYCCNCFRKLNPSNTGSTICNCSCCSSFFFCSPNCQSIALASSHSHWVCKALNTIPSLNLDSESQVQLHFLIAAYNLALTSPPNFQLLISLQGEAPSATALNSQTLALHSILASLASKSGMPPFPGFSPELTTALLAKDKQNAFGLMEPYDENKQQERGVRAYAIYPKASFFNHDCLPNACRFDYLDKDNDNDNSFSSSTAAANTDIIVRAIHDIPHGREICLSYFPVNWNFSDRQRRLLEDYGFACDCDRCKVEANWKDNGEEEEEDDTMDDDNEDEEDMMAAASSENDNGGDDDFPHAYFFLRYVCDVDNCGGTLAPLPPLQQGNAAALVMECNVCGRTRTEEEIDEDGVMMDQ